MSETFKIIQNHSSVRKFTEKSVSREIIDKLIESAQKGPSSSNFQAYTIIEVQSEDKRKTLYESSGNQEWLLEAPLVFLFCGDLNRSLKYFEAENKENILCNTEAFMVATVDATIAAQSIFITAKSFGLGGVYIGGIRNDIDVIRKEFYIPKMVFPIFAMCLGYPSEIPGLKPKLPTGVIHKIDYYDDSKDDILIKGYNQIMSEYYFERTNGKSKVTWIKKCGEALAAKPRDNVGISMRENGILLK